LKNDIIRLQIVSRIDLCASFSRTRLLFSSFALFFFFFKYIFFDKKKKKKKTRENSFRLMMMTTKKLLLLLACAAAVMLVCVRGERTTSHRLTSEQVEKWQELALNDADSLHSLSMKKVYERVLVLTSSVHSGSRTLSYNLRKQICAIAATQRASAMQLGSKKKQLSALYYSLATLTAADCDDATRPLDDDESTLVKRTMTQAKNGADFFYAFASASQSVHMRSAENGVGAKLLNDALNRALSSLVDVDGSGSLSVGSGSNAESALFMGRLCEALGAAGSASLDGAIVQRYADALGALFDEAGASGRDGVPQFLHKGDESTLLVSTAAALRGAAALATVGGVRLPASVRLNAACASVVEAAGGAVGDTAVYSVLSGVGACVSDAFERRRPVSLRVETPVAKLAADASDRVRISVADLLGAPLPTVPTVTARTAALSSDRERPILSNVELSRASGDGLFELDLLAAKPVQGLYSVDLAVDAAAFGSVSSTRRAVKVVTVVTVDEATVVVRRSGSDAVPERLGALGDRLGAPLRVDASAGNSVRVTLSLRAVGSSRPLGNVQQAFLRVVDKSHPRAETYVVASRTAAEYSFVFAPQRHAAALGSRSAHYSLSLIVGDAYIDNSFEWHLGEASIDFGAASAGDAQALEPSYASYYRTLPEIHHQFRPDATRAPTPISMAASLCVAAPWLVLLYALARFGSSPNYVGNRLYALLFQGSLLAIVALYGLAWLQFNMFQTVTYVGALGSFALIVGQRALRSNVEARQQKKQD
jgi:Oligosaccharyltransferase subunit Ribophorin II